MNIIFPLLVAFAALMMSITIDIFVAARIIHVFVASLHSWDVGIVTIFVFASIEFLASCRPLLSTSV